MEKKIPDLPLTAAVNADDTIEKANHNAPPSERFTPAQMATFMQTAMALVQLSGLNIKLNADGSASFAGVKILFNADGSCSFASANAAFAVDGALDLPMTHLLADGSAQFANGAMTISPDGIVVSGKIGKVGALQISDDLGNTIVSMDGTGEALFSGDTIEFHADGTAQFANFKIELNSSGSAVFSSGELLIGSNGSITTTNEFEATTVGASYILKSPDGTRWRIAVSNIGVVTATPA